MGVHHHHRQVSNRLDYGANWPNSKPRVDERGLFRSNNEPGIDMGWFTKQPDSGLNLAHTKPIAGCL
jgi:hypothetical protein